MQTNKIYRETEPSQAINNTINMGTSYEDDEIDILALIQTLLKHIILIIVIIILGTLLTALYSLSIKPEFKATTKFFIPESSSAPSYMSTINSLGFGNIIGGGNTSLEIVTNILNSRRMAKDIINQFELHKKYANPKNIEPIVMDSALMESLIQTVSSRLSVQKDKSNFITLTYEDFNPALASEIANYAVQNLDNINEKLGVTSQKPLVIVLDKAEEPIQRSKPNRKNMVIIGFITSSIMATFLAFAIEYIKNLQIRNK